MITVTQSLQRCPNSSQLNQSLAVWTQVVACSLGLHLHLLNARKAVVKILHRWKGCSKYLASEKVLPNTLPLHVELLIPDKQNKGGGGPEAAASSSATLKCLSSRLIPQQSR